MTLSRTLGALALVLTAQTASATLIDYQLTHLGGTDFRYDYTVTNDGSLGAGVAIEGFTIFFDPTLYDESSLSIATSNSLASDWDELFLSSVVGVPAAYDVFALAGGVAPGESVAGFAVAFTWLGTGAPSAQPFEIYDPVTFNVLATGQTTAIPEPSTLALFLLPAVGLLAAGVRRR